jgi:hypothetical protein
MNMKKKIFVALAFIVAAFYALEVTLTLINQGLVGPAFVKTGIVAASLYFAITRIINSKAANAQNGKSSSVSAIYMNPTNALKSFQIFLNRKRLSAKSMTPRQGVEAMLEFFQAERAEGCEAEHHDMLLYQWGTYDWGKGRHFEFDITRQVIIGEDTEDEGIWQLHVTFRFAPTKELNDLGKGNRWCESVGDVLGFREFINGSASLQTVGDRTDGKIIIDFECAG